MHFHITALHIVKNILPFWTSQIGILICVRLVIQVRQGFVEERETDCVLSAGPGGAAGWRGRAPAETTAGEGDGWGKIQANGRGDSASWGPKFQIYQSTNIPIQKLIFEYGTIYVAALIKGGFKQKIL